MTIQTIDIGCGGKSFILDYIHQYLPHWDSEEIQITRMDSNKDVKPDILHDILKPMPQELYRKYDLVFMSHVLEHIPWRHSVSVAHEVAGLVKPGGYFLLSVPSIEWACKEILRGNFNLTVMMTIYGGQDDEWLVHKCGFTRSALQMLSDRLGAGPGFVAGGGVAPDACGR